MLKRCKSVFDAEGRFAPVYDENDTMTLECDQAYITIGQAMDWGELLNGSKASLGRDNIMKVADISYQSEEPDIFGGGDCVTGPKLAIDAIATGKAGAISIHRFLRHQDLLMKREREYTAVNKDTADFGGFDRMPRQRPAAADHSKATKTMKDLRATLTEEQLKKEADRCLGCGVSVLNPDRCIGCGLCYTRCEFDAIKLKKIADIEPTDSVEEYMKISTEYATTRAQNLAAKVMSAGSGGVGAYSHMQNGRMGE